MIGGLIARLRTPALAGVFVLAFVLLSGCATPQVTSLDARWPAELPDKVELTDVPFFPQEDYECGPAALAMVAGAAGVSVLPDDLVEQVYLPGRKGSLQQEMLAATRRQGLVAYPLSPRLEDLMREVAAGNPVLVFQNLSFEVYPVWHYAVAIGYDRDRNTLVLHSGRTERMEMSLFTFERTWARGQYWSMLALPPTRLPATADASVYTSATAALERLNPKAAQVAYTTALHKWPDERTALLGAGNTAYALGQPSAAIAAYQSAVNHHPDFADAWNNLAQVLMERGDRTQAAEAIGKAVALGGNRLSRYQSLQLQINAK
jgi:tetratricopeptide (TPR) repeat protein